MGAYLDQDRLKTPMVREVGKNGKQTFREASWEEALDIIAQRMQQIVGSHGADRMAMLSHGAGVSILKSFSKVMVLIPSPRLHTHSVAVLADRF